MKFFSDIDLANQLALAAMYDRRGREKDDVWDVFFNGVDFGERIGEGGGAFDIEKVINQYRRFGHLKAHFNPLLSRENTENWDWKIADSTLISCDRLGVVEFRTLKAHLEAIYCQNIGFEYMHVTMPLRTYLCSAIEKGLCRPSKDEQIQINTLLNKAAVFDQFLHTKFPGQKRFSLNGAEGALAVLHALFLKAAEQGVKRIILGMAHRGRLSILCNLLEKPYRDIFAAFSGKISPSSEGSGDVKYHHGHMSTLQLSGQTLEVHLACNPSHLEAVNATVLGDARAWQIQENAPCLTCPILVHGDAAFAGQGSVYEIMQLAKVQGYSTGGTLHIVINNQLGYTAHLKEYSSMHYCTDLGRAFDVPIFHVNGDDPDSCFAVATLAMQLRQKFGTDVIIDVNCARLYGHNEVDEPTFTAPVLYKKIKERPRVHENYNKQLVCDHLLSEEQIEQLKADFHATLEKALQAPLTAPQMAATCSAPSSIRTAIEEKVLAAIGEKITSFPFNLHPKLKKLLSLRKEMVSGKAPIDWGMAEHLAYGSLLLEKHHVRISGQDSQRGTFSHRHVVFIDQDTNAPFVPLNHLSDGQACLEAYSSPLSEYGILGFEYGYAKSYPGSLVIWEAQFGDFANGAQIIIDQFIAASQQKWGEVSPIVVFLPHGYEGQGPEHSSARIERFLQLSAQDNMRIVVPSTPDQLFHYLRLATLGPDRKPSILFTPKALLRYAPSLSSLESFTKGDFQPFIVKAAQKKSKTLILCYGKIYYDLLEHMEGKLCHTVILLQQLYPLDMAKLKAAISESTPTTVVWLQEEHQNMGAWEYMALTLKEVLSEKVDLRYCGRKRAAAPACGSTAQHASELKEIFHLLGEMS